MSMYVCIVCVYVYVNVWLGPTILKKVRLMCVCGLKKVKLMYVCVEESKTYLCVCVC